MAADGSDTALLVMDVQERIVERYGDEGLVERIAAAAETARERGILVVYVKVDFRPGYPEVSRRNKSFARLAGNGFAAGTAIHEGVAPEEGDVVVTKRRVSAFSGSDLELILRARDIHRLVLTGIATSGVVLSTLRQAADLDYELVVLRDCCTDGDADVHELLLEQVFPRQADVVDLGTWQEQLARS